MEKICQTLEQNLKKLNHHLILESSEFAKEERHRVKTWLNILPLDYLKRDSSVKSDIYNEGRLKIEIAPPKDVNHSFYSIFYETPLIEFRKGHR